MKHEVSRRRQPLVRTAVYSLMTLSVVVIVSLLMLVVLGYSFDEHNGRLEQGGLLQFQSIPQGVNVTLDEIKLGSQTNTKSTVDTGSHSVSFDREGYRSWKKTIDITAGQIGWISYARMIPTEIQPESVRSFTTLSSALASPRHNYMLLHEAADSPAFVLANIQGDTVQYKDLALPAGSYTAPSVSKTQSFTPVEWSNDENAVLVRHNYDNDQVEWLLLDRDSPDKSIDISTSFAITPTKLEFAGGGDRLLFVQTADVVRRINLDDQTLSRPLATHVDNFTTYDDKTITFVTTPDEKGKRTVGYAKTDITEPQTIAAYPADGQPLFASQGTYFNHRYVSILHGTQLLIQVGTLPAPGQQSTLKEFAKQTVPAGVSSLQSTRNGRFVVVQLPGGYGTYDIELTKYDNTAWATPPTAPHDLTWLDDYMLWSDNGGTLRFYDFDGANQQNIMPVAEGFSASLSPNNKYVYDVGKTDKGFDLERGRLILP